MCSVNLLQKFLQYLLSHLPNYPNFASRVFQNYSDFVLFMLSLLFYFYYYYYYYIIIAIAVIMAVIIIVNSIIIIIG